MISVKHFKDEVKLMGDGKVLNDMVTVYNPKMVPKEEPEEEEKTVPEPPDTIT